MELSVERAECFDGVVVWRAFGEKERSAVLLRLGGCVTVVRGGVATDWADCSGLVLNLAGIPHQLVQS